MASTPGGCPQGSGQQLSTILCVPAARVQHHPSPPHSLILFLKGRATTHPRALGPGSLHRARTLAWYCCAGLLGFPWCSRLAAQGAHSAEEEMGHRDVKSLI